jgi:hypothetical protein
LKIGELFTFINRHPIMCLFILGSICFYWPQNVPKTYSDGTVVKVERGITYRVASEFDLEVYPFMIQNWMLGAPKEAGISQSIYYVTKRDLEQAVAQYKKNGGCWARTFSSYKREFMAVGDPKKIGKFIKNEGPPPLRTENLPFIRVRGQRLVTLSHDEAAAHMNQVAAMRNAEVVSISSVWKSG